jgi:Bacterial protein of unknown function (DUF899)
MADHLAMNTPPDGVDAGVGGRAPATDRGGEEAHPRPRCAGRRAPPDAADGGGEGVPHRRPERAGEPARPVRGWPPADRLSLLFEPGVAGWPEGGRLGCWMMADQVAHPAHLNARDTTLAYVSRARQPDIERLKARMGWQVPWYTITDSLDATSTSTSGTAATPSCATATGSSGPTSSTIAATRRSAAPGAPSTSARSGAMRSGRTRRRATRRVARMSGGGGTTSTGRRPTRGKGAWTRRWPRPRSTRRSAGDAT